MARREPGKRPSTAMKPTPRIAFMRAAATIVLAWAAAIAAMSGVATAAGAFGLEELAASLAGIARSDADFRETRHLAALTAPIVRTGTLAYVRPDRLEMNVESPAHEQLLIDGGVLTVRSPSGVRTLRLDSEPALRAWTESLRATLAGDVPSLTRHFAATLAGTVDAWKLALEPRDATLRTQIATIDISGKGASITQVEIVEQDGDRSVMEIVARPPRAP